MTQPPPTTRTRVRRIPRVLDISSGALARLPETLRRADFPLTGVLMVYGGPRTGRWARLLAARLAGAGTRVYLRRAAAATDAVAVRMAGEAADLGVDLLIGVGGGRPLDVTKSAALATQLDLVAVPTAVAHDGISSPVASLADSAGERSSQAAVVPAAVIIDLDVVAAAPARILAAGAGDLISNLSAVEDWRLADSRGLDTYDAYSALIADGAARPLLAFDGLSSPAGVEVLAKGLVLSGLAMVTAGSSRPCSGAEHLISHSLDRLLRTRAQLHGEQVALGTVVATTARGQQAQADVLRSAFRRLGLPVHPAELGIPMDLLAEAVRQAPGTRPGRHTVLDEIDLSPAAVTGLLRRAFGE